MAKTKYSEFAAALDTAASLDGTEEVVILQDGLPVQTTTQDIADLGGGAAGYLIYAALLTQAGTDAPVATVLENTLGGTVVWSYNGVGNYSATLAGVFLAGKTFMSAMATNSNDDALCAMERIGDDSVRLYVFTSSFTATDDWEAIPVEIRVYP